MMTKKTVNNSFIISAISILMAACTSGGRQTSADTAIADTVVTPLYTTEPVTYDTDDPAIWVNPVDPAQSLIIGTDKNENGGLYVFDLKGKIIHEKTVSGLKRPNNVDVAYGLRLAGQPIDIAVTTERMTNKLRVFSLPDMKAIDGGGIAVFEGETGPEYRDPMGIALYTAPNGNIYAVVGRKNGPTDGTYLWQYLLEDGGGLVRATLVRKFGHYSGHKEIEAIAVDNELGYVYYADEQIGVRKYYADPTKGNEELALFATQGFADDHEGISIYKTSDSTGYILVSDQQANRFNIYPRKGDDDPHNHPLITSIQVSTSESDGSDIVSSPLNDDFRHGLFVAMSDDKTFQLYRWEDIARDRLTINQ
ncbi:phytase [Parapedobacter deserti]|uniref:Phytase n=1 Tax=Parapedobacter deserti TaxID=1912957 RepID=A0ABV7JQN2_9SPHI